MDGIKVFLDYIIGPKIKITDPGQELRKRSPSEPLSAPAWVFFDPVSKVVRSDLADQLIASSFHWYWSDDEQPFTPLMAGTKDTFLTNINEWATKESATNITLCSLTAEDTQVPDIDSIATFIRDHDYYKGGLQIVIDQEEPIIVQQVFVRTELLHHPGVRQLLESWQVRIPHDIA